MTSIASSPVTSTSPPAMTVPPVIWAVVPGVVSVALTAVWVGVDGAAAAMAVAVACVPPPTPVA